MVRISNLALLQLLMENSRMPFLRIAERLGVSEAAVRKRVKKLEREGVIKGYSLEVDPKKIGFEVNALIGVDTRPEHFVSAIGKLKAMEEVLSLYSSAGDHMLLASGWFENSEALETFVKKLELLEGITKVCPAIIIEKVK